MPDRNIRDLLKRLPRISNSCGIVGRVQQNAARPFCDLIQNFHIGQEALVASCWHVGRLASSPANCPGVGRIIGIDADCLVTGIQDRKMGGEQCGLSSIGYDDLLRRDRHAGASTDSSRQRFSQPRRPCNVRIPSSTLAGA